MESCIVDRSETVENMVATLRSQQRHMAQLRALAGEFAALDFQPIVVIDGRVQPRDIVLPANLIEAMRHTAAEIHRLETQISHRS